jgi:hypothetical protein
MPSPQGLKRRVGIDPYVVPRLDAVFQEEGGNVRMAIGKGELPA